jgi:DNA topoisomerase-1
MEYIKKQTRPPSRFNPGSLLQQLEKNNMGTQATRSNVIDTLLKRGYIQGNKIRLTSLGFAVLDILEMFVPEVLSIEMTRKMEKDIENIQVMKSNANEVLLEAKRILEPVLLKFKENEVLIGNKIYDATFNKSKKKYVHSE